MGRAAQELGDYGYSGIVFRQKTFYIFPPDFVAFCTDYKWSNCQVKPAKMY